MKLFFIFFFTNICLFTDAQYSEFHLDEKELNALSPEIPDYSPYLEYGYYILNKSDSNSFFIERKIALGRFRTDTMVNYSDFQVPRNLVEGNIIPLVNVDNITDYHLTINTHKIPYIKYSGTLVLLLNDLEIPDKIDSINTGSEYYNSYIKHFFDLTSIHRKLLR